MKTAPDTRATPPDSASSGLGDCVQKFEHAITNMRGAQRHWQSSIERVRNLGDRLLNT